MARSKIDISQIAWSEISTGSLGGPASFIGLSTSNTPVLVAASDYTTGGGGGGISFDGSTANGVLTYKDSDEATVESNLTFDGSTLIVSADLKANEYLYHNGDTDTFIRFEDDVIHMEAGGRAFIKISEAGTDKLIINNNEVDIDVQIKGSNSANLLRTDAANDSVYFGANSGAGDDNNFWVSGTIGSIDTSDKGTAVFGGDLVISGTVHVKTQLTASGGMELTAPSGSLGGPASFLGLDATNRVVQIAASDYVDAGGSDTFVTDNFGHFKFTTDNLFGHYVYAYNSRNYQLTQNLYGNSYAIYDDPGDSTFTATIVNSLLYIKSGIVPVACTLDSFTVEGYLVEAMSNGNAKFSIWHATAPSDAVAYSTSVTWTRVATVTWSGTGADDTWYKGTDTVTSGNSFAAGDWYATTVQPSGTDTSLSSGNSSFHASISWSPT